MIGVSQDSKNPLDDIYLTDSLFFPIFHKTNNQYLVDHI